MLRDPCWKSLRALRLAIWLLSGPTLLLIPPLQAKESQSDDVGLVLRLKGEWLLNGKPVAAGEKLPAGGRIYHAPSESGQPPPPDYISVVFFDGRIESRSWDNVQSWSDPIELPRAREEAPSRWSRIVNAVMGVFPGHPERYTQMSVRGPAMEIQDAVVDLNKGRLDLTSALKNLKKGQYLIVLKPIPRTETPAGEDAFKPVLLDWDPKTSAPPPVDNIRSGLYALRIQNAQSEGASGNRPEAWILVSDHAQFERTARAFQDCIALTEQWASKAPADAARSFRHAYLDSLAAGEAR